MRRRPPLVVLALAGALVASGGTSLAATSAWPSGGVPTQEATGVPALASTTSAPSSTAPATTAPTPLAPVTTAPPVLPATTATSPVSAPPIADVIDVGDAKPERFYDGYVSAALADIEAWWRAEYPRLFGGAFVPLEGGVYAAYPERTSPIPGCGSSADSTYQDVSDAGAFYCPLGDFIAYDDGEDGILFQLARQFGPSILAVVMAHEYGHAIQARLDLLGRETPTIYTEQQADCYSGAWARRAWNSQIPGLPFTDADIELGMIALVFVRDPIGNDVLELGGHGSAFDRIGAFQEGFYYNLEGCTDIIDNPLPLQDNEFIGNDAATNGNAPFGAGDDEIVGLLNDDLGMWWQAQLAAIGVTMPELKITAVTDPATNNCANPAGLADTGAIFCASTNEILLDEVYARRLYDDFGDFAVGYIIGRAWSEGVQVALGSALQGEPRGLTSDCLTGAWVGSARQENGVVSPNHSMIISPGDLDEAIQAALVLGDPGINDNIDGSAFERVAYLRLGVLNGLPACLAPIQAAPSPPPG